MTVERQLADAIVDRPLMRAALFIAKEVYSGTDGRAATDGDILRDLANWLDRIDNLTDAALSQMENAHRVDRAMQGDLRRIADRLDREPPPPEPI